MSEAEARIKITGKDAASGEIKKATASVKELNAESNKLRQSTVVPRAGAFYGVEDQRLMKSMAASMREMDGGANMAKKTIFGMQEEAKRLTGQLDNLQYGTAAFTAKAGQLRLVNTELVKMRQHAQALSGQTGLRAAAQGVAGRFGLSLGGGLAVGGAAAVAGIVSESLKAASALEQLETKARVIFGDSFPQINAEATKFGLEVDRARSSILQYATDIGALMESNDIAGDTLAELSTDLSKLTVDLASFYDTSEDEAFNALRSGLVGMVMPMRRFGVDMTEAAMKSFVLRKGLKQAWEEMSTGQKMAVRYAFVMEKTDKAQGDAARTLFQATNQYRAMKDNVKDLFQELGRPAIVVAKVGMIALNMALEAGTGIVREFSNMISESLSGLRTFGVLAMQAIGLSGMLPDGSANADKGFLPKNVTAMSGAEISALMASRQAEKTKLQDMVNGIGGDSSKDKDGKEAAEKLKKIREALEDLGRTARKEYADIGRSIRELDREHDRAMEDIRGEMDQTALKLKEMGSQFDKLAQDWKRTVDKMNSATADLLLGADEKIAGLDDRIAGYERQMEAIKQQGGSISVDLRDDYDRAIAEREREKAGRADVAGQVGVGAAMTDDTRRTLESKLEDARTKEEEYLRQIKAAKDGGGSVGLGLQAGLDSARSRVAALTGQLGVSQSEADAIYQERAGQTDTQRRFADMQKESAERKADHEAKVSELNVENDKLKATMRTLSEKAQKEKEGYQESRTQMQLTQVAMKTFEGIISESFANVNKVTEETVENLKLRFEELRQGIEAWNQLLQDNPNATGGGTLGEKAAARGADRQIDGALGRAAGGPASGLTWVGEQGPELVNLPPNSYVHNNRDSKRMMGGSVSVNFHGMVIQKTADAYEVLRIVGRELEKLKLQAA